MSRRRGTGTSDTAWRIRQIAGPDLALRYLQASPQPTAPAPASAPAPLPSPLHSLFRQLGDEATKALPGLGGHDASQVQGLLGRIGDRVDRQGPGRERQALLGDADRLQQLLQQSAHLVRHADAVSKTPRAQPRIDRVLAALQALKLAAGHQGLAPGGGQPSFEAATDLFVRLGRLTQQLRAPAVDADALALIERDTARPLAAEVADFMAAGHACPARPVWLTRTPVRDTGRLFYSGGAFAGGALQRAAEATGLQVDAAAAHGADAAQARWQSLRCAVVAVFDLAGATPQVCYELGMALATGTRLLLLAPRHERLPFDVSQAVLRYDGDASLAADLPAALDDAVYGLQVHAPRLVGRQDPVARRSALRDACRGSVEVLQPRWPYPSAAPAAAGAGRWFAVLPFRPGPMAFWRRLQALLASTAPDLRCVRGDLAEGEHVMASIWDELCLASHVTADLSDLNPNVCVELGIAHALGHPTLLLGEPGTAERLAAELPGLSKWRCHTYRKAGRRLPDAVTRFFGGTCGET